MALSTSQKPTREWPLLILTILLVGAVVYPLWTTFGVMSTAPVDDPADTLPRQPRWAQLLLGPEQVACYCCFVWSIFIFIGRYAEMMRQRRAFGLHLLPTDDGARILTDDARGLQRQIDQATEQQPYILANMIRAGLAKLSISRSSQDVRETLKTQSEVDLGKLVASMATLNYLAWAIPAIGFFGTVRGLAASMTMAHEGGQQLVEATRHLTVAFDCTLVALGLSLVVMFLIHTLQREEESLVIDCQQYCLDHLVNRIYEPELGAAAAGADAAAQGPVGMIAGTLPERAAR